MQKYNDQTNASGMRVLFMIVQMAILTVVYIIVYTSFVAVQYSINNTQHISSVAYVPVVVSLILFPVLLYTYRQMFYKGKMLRASVWTISSASVIIVALYLYVNWLTV